MYRRRLALVLLCGPLLLASPGVDAQGDGTGTDMVDERVRADGAACWDGLGPDSGSTCTVLYAHLFGPRNNAFLNTQRPPEDFTATAASGNMMPGYEAVWDYNQITLRPTAHKIDHDSPHHAPHEVGVTGNITMDADRPLLAYWYLSPDATQAADQDPKPDLGALPCLTVRIQVFETRFASEGALATEGQATKTLVSTGGTSGELAPEGSLPCAEANEAAVRADEVAVFQIALPSVDLKRHDTFSVQVEWWNHAPGDPDEADKMYLAHWKVHSDPDHRPRLVLPMQNGIDVFDVETTMGVDKVDVHALLQTPWGAYDVARESVAAQVLDDAGEEVIRLEPFEIGPAVRHDAAYRPVVMNATWNLTETDPSPGRYTVRITATDLQGTREAMGEVDVWIERRVEESAGPPIVFLGPVGLAVAVGARALRRRHVGR